MREKPIVITPGEMVDEKRREHFQALSRIAKEIAGPKAKYWLTVLGGERPETFSLTGREEPLADAVILALMHIGALIPLARASDDPQAEAVAEIFNKVHIQLFADLYQRERDSFSPISPTRKDNK